MSEQLHVSGPMYRPSRDDGPGMDPRTVRLLYFGAFGGLAILAGVAVWGLTGHSGGGALPVIQAVQGPLKVKPENPGGMAVAPEEKIANPNESRLAPSTEEPNPRALLALTGAQRVAIPPVPPAPPRVRTITVQLAAAKSEAEAQAAWNRLAKKLPDLARYRALFQKTNEPGPSPWRLRTGGFADPAQAKTFCEKVRAKGGQCSVVES